MQTVQLEQQQRRRPKGLPESLRPALSAKVDRFWNKIDKTSDPDGCWLWTANQNSGSYGQLGRKINGRCIMILAHRMAFFLTKGEIPPNHDVRHTCGERLCCNPDHLFLRGIKAPLVDEQV